MKINKPHNFLLLALTAVLSCCSGEDYSDITVSGSSAAPLSITVTDNGYASLSGGTSTRTYENEESSRTVFTEGDQIGIFAVKDGAIVEGISNLCLTAHAATDANAALTWQSADNKTPFNIDGATYYAYYPYKPDIMSGVELNLQADDAAGFFAGVISKWTPATDQSTHAKYTAQDLMIAKGTLTSTADGSGKSLSFSMKHQMVLVKIDIPFFTYSFTSDLNLPQYIIDFSDKKFNGFTPCRIKNGLYRYLVKPSAEGTLLSGSYTGLHDQAPGYTGRYCETTWEIDTKDIRAGSYWLCRVDGGRNEEVGPVYKLKVGDFFMKDGKLISGDGTLTPEQRDDCIGIVFWVGDATKIDRTLRKDYPDCRHGLVVALEKGAAVLSNQNWQTNSRSVQDWLDENRPDKYLSVLGGTGGSMDPLNNIQGYNNTKAIEEFNSAMSTWRDQVKAVSDVVFFRNRVPAPVHTSGWYLPSVKELALLCGGNVDIRTNKDVGTDNRDVIEKKLFSIGNTRADPLLLPWSPFSYISEYWSSTEFSIGDAFYVDFYSGNVSTMKKDEKVYVRYVLAF